MADVVFRGTRADLYRRLLALPAVLAGKAPDTDGTARKLLEALGIQALSLIKDAYVTKARGGTDAAGIKWDPLDPRTIAYGRRHPGLNQRRKYAASKGRGSRPLLSAAQDKRWRQIYAAMLNKFRGDADASAHAAAVAWSVVKREGGQTILGKYGGAQVEIGRDTGRLLASLSPGAPDNILRTTAGAVTIGTAVQYAPHFHKKRPIWPANFPPEWKAAMEQIVAEALALAVQRMGRT